MKIAFTVDAASINTGVDQIGHHLKTDNFLMQKKILHLNLKAIHLKQLPKSTDLIIISSMIQQV